MSASLTPCPAPPTPPPPRSSPAIRRKSGSTSSEGDCKDHEFSATSMREHWQSGYEDTKRTLMRRDWLQMPQENMGIVVHDVHRERDY